MTPCAVRLVALALFLALGSATAAPESSPAALSPSQERSIEAAARKELRAFGGREPIPGVFIALYLPGKPPYIKSVGYADLRSKAPFTYDDRFRVGSNTKTFVVTVLLQLVDEGRLRLDDPLSSFRLGVTVPNARNITVRQLCEMRSGLFEAYNTPQFNKMHITPQTRIAPQELVRWAVEQKPLFAPGARYNYSNTNYLLLGLVIEALTRDTVANQIRKRLLKPMALTGTTFPDGPSMPKPYSQGYGLNAKR
ncbi:MAG TPA: serine hydrolase domain-containing protein, partial [Candidatus Acidoferrum sp.]|nr:serine hydrolase domain-containing protein [Candidatus Acidoferrum sp.]